MREACGGVGMEGNCDGKGKQETAHNVQHGLLIQFVPKLTCKCLNIELPFSSTRLPALLLALSLFSSFLLHFACANAIDITVATLGE